jgi:PPOX class probable F420-dependent enzyme
MRRRFAHARVARLGTVNPDGSPHLVPICFALVGDRVVSIVDQKPKSTTNLRRLTNIRANPNVTLLVDHYDEDWTSLWWIRVDGRAFVVDDDGAGADDLDPLLVALHDKYRGNYGRYAFSGPTIVVDVERWSGWTSSNGGR